MGARGCQRKHPPAGEHRLAGEEKGWNVRGVKPQSCRANQQGLSQRKTRTREQWVQKEPGWDTAALTQQAAEGGWFYILSPNRHST